MRQHPHSRWPAIPRTPSPASGSLRLLSASSPQLPHSGSSPNKRLIHPDRTELRDKHRLPVRISSGQPPNRPAPTHAVHGENQDKQCCSRLEIPTLASRSVRRTPLLRNRHLAL